MEAAKTPKTKHARAVIIEPTRKQTRDGKGSPNQAQSLSLPLHNDRVHNARVLYHVAASPREVIAAPFLRCFEVCIACLCRSYR